MSEGAKAALRGVEERFWERRCEALREDNRRLIGRLAQYRRMADAAMADRREIERERVWRERALWAVGMIAGLAVAVLAGCKAVEWVRWIMQGV